MPSRKRNFVTQKVIPESEKVEQRRIENEEVDALNIKFEAFNHFLAMVTQNHESIVSEYSRQFLEQHEVLGELGGSPKEGVDESISVSEIHNSMFMLKIENERLRCKEKLLQQKLECQKVLYRKRRQDSTSSEQERRMKVEEIKLLKEEVSVLEKIVEKKRRLKQGQAKKEVISAWRAKLRATIETAGADLVERLSEALSQMGN